MYAKIGCVNLATKHKVLLVLFPNINSEDSTMCLEKPYLFLYLSEEAIFILISFWRGHIFYFLKGIRPFFITGESIFPNGERLIASTFQQEDYNSERFFFNSSGLDISSNDMVRTYFPTMKSSVFLGRLRNRNSSYVSLVRTYFSLSEKKNTDVCVLLYGSWRNLVGNVAYPNSGI